MMTPALPGQNKFHIFRIRCGMLIEMSARAVTREKRRLSMQEKKKSAVRCSNNSVTEKQNEGELWH